MCSDDSTGINSLQCFGVPKTAKLLDLSPDSVRVLIEKGILAASNVAATGQKARWKITAADITNFLAARRNIPPTPAPRRRKSARTDDARYY
jgi:hypothetical protein